MTASYQSRFGTLSVCAQPSSTAGLSYGDPLQFQATSNGAAGGTTVISTSLDAGANSAYVGNLLECIAATNTDNIGCVRRIKAFDESADTATVDAFPAQVSSGDKFRNYVTNDGKFIATSAVVGGATIVATGRTEADDYWNGTAEQGGYYVETVNADNALKTDHPRITDWANGTNTATLSAAVTGDVAIGDFFRAVKHPEVTGIVIAPREQPDVMRDTLVGGFGHYPHAAGLRSATAALELLHRGPGASDPGGETDMHEFMRSCFTPTEVADCTVDSGSTTTAIEYDAGSPSVGEMFCTEHGDMLVCVADDGDTITPSPKLRTAPDNDTTLYGAMTYAPATTLQKALTLYNFLGSGVERELYGCAAVPTFSSADGGYTRISFQISSCFYYEHVLDHAGSAVERLWDAKVPTVDAIRGRDIRLALWDGTTLVDLNCLGWTFNPGIEIKRIRNDASPNDVSGYEIVNIMPSGTFRTRVDSTTRRLLADAEAKKEWSIMLSAGAAAGFPGILGIWAYSATIGVPPITDDGGELALDCTFTVNKSATGDALGLEQFYVGAA